MFSQLEPIANLPVIVDGVKEQNFAVEFEEAVEFVEVRFGFGRVGIDTAGIRVGIHRFALSRIQRHLCLRVIK